MIPPLLLLAVKNLLRIPNADTAFDARIQRAYDKALIELVRETDIFVYEQQIPSVADKSIYAATAGMTRILAVFHDRMQLMLVPSRSLDLLTTWQKDASGDPEMWSMDKLPPGLDGLVTTTPLQFAIHPAPMVDGAGFEGVVIYRVAPPPNDEPMPWVFPFLIYQTAAFYSGEDTEEHDSQAATFWGGLAGVWRELLVS